MRTFKMVLGAMAAQDLSGVAAGRRLDKTSSNAIGVDVVRAGSKQRHGKSSSGPVQRNEQARVSRHRTVCKRREGEAGGGGEGGIQEPW